MVEKEAKEEGVELGAVELACLLSSMSPYPSSSFPPSIYGRACVLLISSVRVDELLCAPKRGSGRPTLSLSTFSCLPPSSIDSTWIASRES